MITLRTFIDPVQAAVVVSFLKDNNIEAVLLDENSSSYTSARLLVPIRLQVPDQQAGYANSLLENFDVVPDDIDGNRNAE
jgi:Putative prokaryotic signal transducing protein